MSVCLSLSLSLKSNFKNISSSEDLKKRYIKTNENKNTIYQNLGYAKKVVQMGEVYSITGLPQETNKQTKISKNLALHIKKLEKQV